MRIIIVVFLFALAMTTISTPWVRRLALRLHFVDSPNARKLHEAAIPLMGGVAIFAGATAAFLLFLLEFTVTERVIGVFLAVTVMAAVGLVDDRQGMKAWTKLGGQLVGSLILLYFGVSVSLPVPEVLNYLLTVGWVIAISNAFNFLDNMDGLCAGVSAVAAAFIVLIGAMNHQALVAALGAAVLGASLGFLRHNFKPARIFMGDSGSLSLGFIVAVLGILLRFPDNVNFVTWMVPVFVLGVPIFDTTLVFLSRIRRGDNPFTTAGRDHTSHRLVKLGFTEKEAVLLLYLAGGAGGMVGIFVMQANFFEGYLVGVLAAVAGLGAIWQLEKDAS